MDGIELLITELTSKVKELGIIKFNNLEFSKDNNAFLIKIDNGKYNIWVRESSILGYYKGLSHTFFIISNDLDISDQSSFDYVKNQIKKGIEDISTKNIKNVVNGNVDFVFYKKPDKSSINMPIISDDTKKRVQDIWNSLNKESFKYIKKFESFRKF